MNKIKHISRLIYVCIIVWCSAVTLHATEKAVPTVMRAWQLDAWTGIADSVAIVDTSYMHLPMRDMLNEYSIANLTNSNLISPTLSQIYFDRKRKSDFICIKKKQFYLHKYYQFCQ